MYNAGMFWIKLHCELPEWLKELGHFVEVPMFDAKRITKIQPMKKMLMIDLYRYENKKRRERDGTV